MNMIAVPEWTEYRKKHGLDPLGMQNISVGLYQMLLPGISNVTLRIRYYGLYAWLASVYAVLGSLRLEKHPDKTFIGRIEKGFDFLGIHFNRDALTVANTTIEKFVERAVRLYEQDREAPCNPSRLDTYVRRWQCWRRGVAPRVA